MNKKMFLISMFIALVSSSSYAAQDVKMKISCKKTDDFGVMCVEKTGFFSAEPGVLGMSEEVSDSLQQMRGTYTCEVKAAAVTTYEGTIWGIYRIYSCERAKD